MKSGTFGPKFPHSFMSIMKSLLKFADGRCFARRATVPSPSVCPAIGSPWSGSGALRCPAALLPIIRPYVKLFGDLDLLNRWPLTSELAQLPENQNPMPPDLVLDSYLTLSSAPASSKSKRATSTRKRENWSEKPSVLSAK